MVNGESFKYNACKVFHIEFRKLGFDFKDEDFRKSLCCIDESTKD